MAGGSSEHFRVFRYANRSGAVPPVNNEDVNERQIFFRDFILSIYGWERGQEFDEWNSRVIDSICVVLLGGCCCLCCGSKSVNERHTGG